VGGARAEATLSGYRMDMRDELDFDVSTLRYVNIGRSRHRGLETSLVLSGLGPASLFATHALQDVTSRSGAFAGKHLKAIPRQIAGGGVALEPHAGFGARVSATTARGMYLDDDNTQPIPSYTRVDAQLDLRHRALRLVIDVRNLLGARYYSTGFLDPGGSGEAYQYPAAGRIIEIGVRRGW
jgi:outer membrane receptor protein involved in Fe transport